MAEYILTTGTTAAGIERSTGLKSYDTPFGVLVEERSLAVPIFAIAVAMSEMNGFFHPRNPSGCTCGPRAFIHRPECSFWRTAT